MRQFRDGEEVCDDECVEDHKHVVYGVGEAVDGEWMTTTITDGQSDGEEAVFSALTEMREIIKERDGSGDPHEIHAVIASFWSTYLDCDVDGQDVARMMSLLKIARAIEGDGDRDDDLDGANYMAIAASMWDAK